MSSSSRDFVEPSCTPPLAESPRRLEPPQLSRTPDLTSRYLERISDGFFLASDVFKSDDRYHLETDNDDEWQRNLCSEPREYQSRRQPNISKSTYLQIPIFGFMLLSGFNGRILVQQQASVSTGPLLLLFSTVVLCSLEPFL
ncbi:hypothetical protein Mapa_002784 [Marchantia paleacea]|nr:hypothetical protein Mapa_002784 [Marchantia paleacea]